MVANVYTEANHLFSFTHPQNEYLISLYDALWQRIWLVPFHGEFTKVWVLQFNPEAYQVSYYKEFDFEGINVFDGGDWGRFINSIKFSTDYWLFVAIVDYEYSDYIKFDEILESETGFYNKNGTGGDEIENEAQSISLTTYSPVINTYEYTWVSNSFFFIANMSDSGY